MKLTSHERKAVESGAIILGSMLLAFGIGAAIKATSAPTVPTVECVTEDSDNCVWHADQHGNGLGRSFYVIDGTVTYLS